MLCTFHSHIVLSEIKNFLLSIKQLKANKQKALLVGGLKKDEGGVNGKAEDSSGRGKKGKKK